MRKLAFGYSTRCNIRCGHCVAADARPAGHLKMDQARAKTIMVEMAEAGVGGISFSAGEPMLDGGEIGELVGICRQLGIYTRIVTNSFWAASEEASDRVVAELKDIGLGQLRLSYSRWHQQQISRDHVLNAARSCRKIGLDYYISFVTDFADQDGPYERFLREHGLKFFPEPVIYSGRAESFKPRTIRTDYQANCCEMNPYLSPELDMYGCCDAGSHFSGTNFFYLGNLGDNTFAQLFRKSETDRLYNLIRHMGLTNIASYLGMDSREIITFSKCALCRKLFNDPLILTRLRTEVAQLESWRR